MSNSQNLTRIELEMALGTQLNALISEAHALNVRTAAAFEKNMQPAAFLIVRWLYSHGPATATKIAESIAMDRSSISRLINQLKKLGFVKSEPNPNDRRGVVLRLTGQGHDRLSAVLQEKESIYLQRISGLSDEELTAYINMLKKLTNDSH